MQKIEKETIIDYNDAEKTAHVYTCNYYLARKIETYALDYPDKVRIIHPWVSFLHEAIDAEVPKSWFHITPPIKREMTPEQKAANAERLRKAREAKAASLLAESADKYGMAEDV